MNNIIPTLSNLIYTVRPQYYRALKQPLSDAEIESFEKKYSIVLPNDLKALYKWKNGQHASCSESFVNNSMFIPLEEALSTASELTSMIGTDFELDNWWNEKWIPNFHNGGGDYICYDLGGIATGDKGQLVEFWHTDKDRNIIAPSLKTFLSQAISYYETAPEIDEYVVLKKINGYPKKFTAG